MDRFTALLPQLTELAELSSAVSRLAEQLRKTQRRCNALSRIFIPNFQSTIKYIAGALEERERESFVILKMVRDRVQSSRSAPTCNHPQSPAFCRHGPTDCELSEW